MRCFGCITPAIVLEVFLATIIFNRHQMMLHFYEYGKILFLS